MSNLNRREALAGAVTATLAGASVPATAASPTKTAAVPDNILGPGAALLRGGPLMNLERAYQVMTEDGFDGLVLCAPINVYHLSGYSDHVAVSHDAPSSFVLLSRDSRRGPGLVMSQFLYYYSFADHPLDWPLQPFLFSGWDTQLAAANGQASAPYVFGDLKAAPLRGFEQHRLDKNAAALARGPLSGSATLALARAAREIGLDRGRIGCDSVVVAAAYESAGLEAKPVHAAKSIRRIRLIKSPREIGMMRLAARANAEAALAAVKTVRAGATHRELRAAFVAECARRGNTVETMQIDTIVAETAQESFRDGSAFAIDCLSHGLQYRGDFGRTVFVGEPSRANRRATEAISFAWDVIREQLRPGLRYSDIKRIGGEALRKGGYDLDVAFSPHSVGLAHTDEPGKGGQSDFWVKDDLELQKDMVLSVDLPVRQSGMGGSAHLEDLTLITATGGVQINETGHRSIVV